MPDFVLPPESLRWRVTGRKEAEGYITSGTRIAIYMAQRGRYFDESFGRESSVLDWGCGAGRVLRAMHAMTDARLTGCDIDAEAIVWAREHLGYARFEATGEYPPLPFAEGEFDFVYGISVLTHLDEEHQFAWLAEMSRVVRPGGLVMLTFRAADMIEAQAEPARTQLLSALDARGFAFHDSGFWGETFPAYYQGTYHTADYVTREWGRYFDVLALDPARQSGQRPVWMRRPS